jgi:hypothetical protein
MGFQFALPESVISRENRRIFKWFRINWMTSHEEHSTFGSFPSLVLGDLETPSRILRRGVEVSFSKTTGNKTLEFGGVSPSNDLARYKMESFYFDLI